jgi:histidyl-tRNA synthetase
MVKGTRILIGDDAYKYSSLIEDFRSTLISLDFAEVIVPILAEQEVFVQKAGEEILNQMYTFKDKGDRDLCLIPEVTAIIQKEWKDSWSKNQPRPFKIFYVSRCYR